MHYSPIGIAISTIAISVITLTAFVYNKDQFIVEKLDVYMLIIFLSAIALRYQELIQGFTSLLFAQKMNNITEIQVFSLIVGIVLYIVFRKISKNKQKLITKAILNTAGMFLCTLGMSVFFWGKFYLPNLTIICITFAFFISLSLCRTNRASVEKLLDRPQVIAFALAILSVILSVFFPNFRITDYKLSAFLSIKVFPWYMITLLVTVFGTIIGIGLHLNNERIDEDTIFLCGLIGLVLVVKAATCFYFQLSWVAICVYSILFISFANRFVMRSASGAETYIHLWLPDNEMNWIMLTALGTIVSIWLIHTGYVYFWLSLLVGVPLILFLHHIATGWRKDAILWISILFCIAFSTVMISIQNGFTAKKIVLISAMFIFTSIVILMLSYKNQVGRNMFRGGKIAIVLCFAILSLIAACKAGTHAAIKLEPKSAGSGSFITDNADLHIKITPDGKQNKVRNVRYVWTDTFLFDERDVSTTNKTSFTIPVENHHLILWAEDANGVVSRMDYWFDDAYR